MQSEAIPQIYGKSSRPEQGIFIQLTRFVESNVCTQAIYVIV
jgi:hypothetical protein